MNTLGGLFKTLADETRLRLIYLFLRSSDSLCVCELVDALGLPQYQVSRHLSALKAAGLVQATKQGTWAYHYLEEGSPLIQALWTFLREAPLSADSQEQIQQDYQALTHRLALRSNGCCVVGLNPNPLKDPTPKGDTFI
ncbi:transcriptional regulator, ArsR family [Alkalispirochaeta americana]|uniref:Transcriptional regulator, ArsR family n=1 Tax=Alkalispirochaeta americana TaxID=159291 RepID=A0A1N6SIK4_9SPIO|nr:metalloregulator ArsR/SmtB family transcription factor [Alkalispirochaeta americana]SIQ40766.1 transcriptional regulator, ArsR family [Alkalispirochaeta americana]